ncbi:MAG: PhnD/SsuA/transferrin family substrate-binding protein [Chromatiales bacterium]|nr:PhnD/SsuA/transferrin family substrate-binding protein [Chromatiales bacterium]
MLVTCAECEAGEIDFHQAEVATVEPMLVTRVACVALGRKGIVPATLQSCSSWMGVVHALYRERARLGILYKDFYEDMSELSRSTVRMIGETSERSVYHCFMLAPRHAALAEGLRQAMLGMADEADGADILARLHMERLVAVAPADLEVIRSLRG